MAFIEEIYLRNGALIWEEEWHERIDALHREAGDAFTEDTSANREALHQNIVQAILDRARGHARVGVLFSGGLDSSLIAAILHKNSIDVTCFTAGYQDGNSQIPLDIEAARLVKEHLGVRWVFRVFNFDEAQGIMRTTAQILGERADGVSVGVGSVVVAASELAKAEGITALFSGLGSEELYAGYERHAKAADVHAECWTGLRAMWARDLARDCAISKALGIQLLTPFLDHDVIVSSMRFSPSTKIGPAGSKLLLRRIAEPYLAQFSERKKKAAQYGSAFQKALEKASREAGVGIKEYVQSLAGSATPPQGTSGKPATSEKHIKAPNNPEPHG